MSTKATYIGPTQFSITGSRAGEYPAGLRVLADCTTDGLRLGSVTSAAYSAGRTTITLDVDGGAVLTASLASVRHAGVGLDSLPRHANMHSADGPDPLDVAGLGFASADNLAEEVEARQAHEASANPHSDSASTSDLEAVVSELVAHEGDRNPHGTTAADVGASPSAHNHDGTYSPVGHLHAGTYAPAAQGVTNGDSHNHDGGDGGQIAHSSLSGAGANSHAAIDNHLGSTSNPHGTTAAQVGLSNVTNDAQIPLAQRGMPGGVPTLDGDGFVAQDPASAAETPGPGKIPRAGLSGLLDTWISAASTTVAGLVQLATNAVAWAGTSTSQVITAAALWYVLTLATRLRISANTTIYVSPTGSDSTGAGTAGAPYASITRALLSIAGKSIDDGVTVTVKVADGVYYVTNIIVIGHPDADKIRIIGNDGAETQLSISSIDTANRKFIFSGVDYSSYFYVGDILRITSGTTANQGAYSVASVEYTGGNTEVIVNQAIASAVVGGGAITVMPANKCVLICSVTCFQVKNCQALSIISGFRIQSSTLTNSGVVVDGVSSVEIYKSIVSGFSVGLYSGGNSKALLQSSAILGSATGVRSTGGANTTINACGIGSCTSLSLYADNGGFNRFLSSGASNNAGGNAPSPAFGVASSTSGFNSNS